MKKLALTITFLLGMTLGAFADWNSYEQGWMLFNLFNSNLDEQEETNARLFEDNEVNAMMWNNVIEAPTNIINYEGGGMFGRGKSMYTGVGNGLRDGIGLFLPGGHGTSNDESAPLSSGVILLLGMGAAYAMKKRREK